MPQGQYKLCRAEELPPRTVSLLTLPSDQLQRELQTFESQNSACGNRPSSALIPIILSILCQYFASLGISALDRTSRGKVFRIKIDTSHLPQNREGDLSIAAVCRQTKIRSACFTAGSFPLGKCSAAKLKLRKTRQSHKVLKNCDGTS